MDNNQVKELISSYLADITELNVSGQDCNFSIQIISNDFVNMSVLERHKKIMELFKDLLQSGDLHALSLDLKTPNEA